LRPSARSAARAIFPIIDFIFRRSFETMLIDLVLAIAHHILIFLIAGIIAAEAVLVRPGLSGAGLKLLSRIDAQYGAAAGLVILVGIGRVIFGLKGWEAYVYNWAFWAKMAAFVAVGLLSIRPTMQILKWRNAAARDAAYIPPPGEIAAVRGSIIAEAAVFVLIPIFAATMARYGY
jgi:putative membrane protein